jgi:amino acid transporter
MSCVSLCQYAAALVIVYTSCTFASFSGNPTLMSYHYLLPCIAVGTLQCFFLCVICSYVLRMKEFERERRLLQRKKRIEARSQLEEALVA